jgi:hypothetical protein
MTSAPRAPEFTLVTPEGDPVTIAREVTVWLPRAEPVEEGIFREARDEESSREWPELAPAARPSLVRPRRGRHRVPARWGRRLGIAAVVIGIAAATFGSGLALGQTWSIDGGESIARQLETWRTGIRDTLLGV